LHQAPESKQFAGGGVGAAVGVAVGIGVGVDEEDAPDSTSNNIEDSISIKKPRLIHSFITDWSHIS
jgi:hypothetical protein